MATIEMKRTEIGKSYWNETGAYEKETNELWSQLVPAQGKAPTVNGELIRIAHRLYHEYFNNGNGNARWETLVNDYSWRDEDEEDEYSYSVDEYWQKMIDYVRYTCHDHELNGLLTRIEQIIVEAEDFSTDNEHTYDLMMDHIVYYVLTHEDKARID